MAKQDEGKKPSEKDGREPSGEQRPDDAEGGDAGAVGWLRSSDDVEHGFIRAIDSLEVKPVTYNVIDELAIFEGDIVLGTREELAEIRASVDDATAADHEREVPLPTDPGSTVEGIGIPGLRYRWPRGVMPYTVVDALRNVVDQAIAHIQARTRIRFVERTAANASQYPNWVSFEQQTGCWSHVGMQTDKQVVSLGPGCAHLGIAVHEILHALGLWHEQSREDRDGNVQILWANILPGRAHNFEQRINDGDDIGPYDFGSIMHYPRRAFSKEPATLDTIVPQGGQAIGQRDGLSAGDIAAIRAMYPELEPSRSWRGTQFSGSLAPGQSGTWFTHSWPSHWFVSWHVVPTAPVIDGPAQLELTVRMSRQADRADARLVKYHLTVRNVATTSVTFAARYEVLGWHPSFL
jgi:hypothetical protein